MFLQYDNTQMFILYIYHQNPSFYASLVCYDTLCTQVCDLSVQFKASCVKNEYTPINLPQLVG